MDYGQDLSLLTKFTLVVAHMAANSGEECYVPGIGREAFQFALYKCLHASAHGRELQEKLGVTWEWDGSYPTSPELYAALKAARTIIAPGEFFLPPHKAIKKAQEDKEVFEEWQRDLPPLLRNVAREVAGEIVKTIRNVRRNEDSFIGG